MRIIPTPRIVDIPTGYRNVAGTSRALVPAAAATPVSEAPITRPDARFVVQMIATAAHAPQVCARCRAEVADGMTVYGKVAKITDAPRPTQGRILSLVA